MLVMAGIRRVQRTRLISIGRMRFRTYRVAQNWHNFCTHQLCQILIDFQNNFTVRIRRKFVIILSLQIPPHLKYVPTLPCEMSSVLEATTENKTPSVITHCKKLTTGNNVFIVSDHHLLTCRLGVPPAPAVTTSYSYRPLRKLSLIHISEPTRPY